MEVPRFPHKERTKYAQALTAISTILCFPNLAFLHLVGRGDLDAASVQARRDLCVT